jgi:AcrR family transcriptional regulator
MAKAKAAAKKTSLDKPVRVRLEVDERRAQLLALGMQMFSSTDYDEVSLDDVAKQLAISKGLIYHYFPTKKDFFSACVEEAAEKLLEMTAPDESLPPAEMLSQGVRAYLQYVETHRGGFVALMRGRSSGEIAKILERTRQRLLDRIIAKLPFVEKDDPRLVLALRGWIGFVEALSLEWAARDDVPLEEPLELALATFTTCVAHVATSWESLVAKGAVAAVRSAQRFLGVAEDKLKKRKK